ncbi:hypothetical protein KR52_01540 [Synechococcus sp. KORDI-52]|nr:hypothetical protein KR52_01540 [Synechococcus sp. KORDI-52]
MVKSSVSVITITYNDLKNLKKTVESFKKFSALNTQFKLEYIVIDGNSTDGTKSYLQSQSQYIDKFISEKDSGIYDAMNKGIKMAGKEYVWFMNAGDEFIPKKLFKLDLLLKEHAYDVIYGDRIYIDTDDNKEYTQKAKKISEIQYGMCFGHQSTIYNRQILEKYLFNLTYKYAGDYEQLIRLYLNNKSFKYISFPLCRFYSGGASESGIGPHLEATYIQSKYFKADTLKKSRYINGSIIHLKNIMEEVKHGN